MRESALEAIRSFAAAELQIPSSEINLETRLDDLEMDSLDRVRMIVELEAALNKALPAEAFVDCQTIACIVETAVQGS